MSIDNGEVKYYQPRFAKWIQSAKWDSIAVILSILVDTFISKISFPMQPGPEIGSISDA